MSVALKAARARPDAVEVTGLVVVGQLVLVLAAFWLPGAVVLRTAGVRGLTLASLAPLATTGLVGAGATVAGATGVPWDLMTAALLTAVAAGGVFLARSRSARHRPGRTATDAAGEEHAPLHLRVLPWAGVTVAAVVPLVALLRGIGDLSRVPGSTDALFHLNALELVRGTGRASSFEIATLAGEDFAGRFYPAAWHGIAGLVPVLDERMVLYTLAAFVPVVVVWALGLAQLARVVLPEVPAAHALAPVVGALVGAAPVHLVWSVGLVANAWALALVPAALAAVAARWRSGVGASAAATLAGAALATAHPSALVPAVVVAAPLVAARVLESRRPLAVRVLGVLGIAAGAVGLWAAVAAFAPHNRARLGEPADLPIIWRDLTTGSTGLVLSDATVLMVLALIGAVLAARSVQTRWLTVAAGLVVVWFVVLRLRMPALTIVFDPWYGEARRLGPVLTVVVALLAGLAVDRALRALVARGHLQTSLPAPVAAVVVGAVLLAVPAWQAAGALRSGAAAEYGHGGAGRLVSEAEQTLLTGLDPWPGGVVLGSPASGAAHLYGTAGVPVVLGYVWSVADDDVALVDAAVARGSVGGPQVCSALTRLGVTHLYVDTEPAYAHEGAEFDVVPRTGVQEVDRAGTARLLRITGCT